MKIAVRRALLFTFTGLAVSLIQLFVWQKLTVASPSQQGAFLRWELAIGLATSTFLGATVGFAMIPAGTVLTRWRIVVFGGLFSLMAVSPAAAFSQWFPRDLDVWRISQAVASLVCLVAVPAAMISARLLGDRRRTARELALSEAAANGAACPSDPSSSTPSGTKSPAGAGVIRHLSLANSVALGALIGGVGGFFALGLSVFFLGWINGARAPFVGVGGPAPAFSVESAWNSLAGAIYLTIFLGWAPAISGTVLGAVLGLILGHFLRLKAMARNAPPTTPLAILRPNARPWYRFQFSRRSLLWVFPVICLVLVVVGVRFRARRIEGRFQRLGAVLSYHGDSFASHIPLWGGLYQNLFPASVRVVEFNGRGRLLKKTDLDLLAQTPDVEQLWMSDLTITDEGFKSLVGLRKLRLIEINRCNITRGGLGHLSDAASLNTLRLFEVPLTDAGVVEVARLNQLRRLELSHVTIQGEGARALAGMQNLKELELSDATLSDEAIREMHRMENLDKLGLRRIRASEEQLTDLGLELGPEKVRLSDASRGLVPGPATEPPSEASAAVPRELATAVPRMSPSGPPPPLAKSPFDAAQALESQAAWAKHLGVPVEFTNSVGMTFRLIPPGEFMLGATQEDINQKAGSPESCRSATPSHRVRLTRAYYLAVSEVTQQQFERVTGRNPSIWSSKGPEHALAAEVDTRQHPVDTVTFVDAVRFCNQLSKQERLSPSYLAQGNTASLARGDGYRLPTEAEWEWACRAGTTSYWAHGENVEGLKGIAWFRVNSEDRPHEVQQLSPNAFGLYDMLGNVGEITQDAWAHDTYKLRGDGLTENPHGPAAVPHRVVRGGN